MAKTVSLRSLLNTYHGMRKLNQNLKNTKAFSTVRPSVRGGRRVEQKKKKKRKKERIEKRIIEEEN